MDAFGRLVGDLQERGVRFVVIGVWGANYYAHSGSTLFTTLDRDLFLPPEPANLMAAWSVCESSGMSLWAGADPLDAPRDGVLAKAVVGRRALTRASDSQGLDVDLSLVMAGYEFDQVWRERRMFRLDEVEIPVARLTHIVQSKGATGRAKDRLFLETHAQALELLLGEETRAGVGPSNGADLDKTS